MSRTEHFIADTLITRRCTNDCAAACSPVVRRINLPVIFFFFFVLFKLITSVAPSMPQLFLSVLNIFSGLQSNLLRDTWTLIFMEEDDYQWWTEEDLWKFPPPPPRPPFLEPPYPDGLTTCDLCTWALQPLDGTDNGVILQQLKVAHVYKLWNE
ncbi:uncharacterized protein LOC112693061 isoform X3 [Sipha flava]|uniref:Uncharacterized protein LOC112693061 isoform X3 n=1 Tax=Sipha flava TaxID=143950 RepID=A0A8B8GN00_9HEMI|nr:uncharacterized protein LOC112693061 isoform X3 [Sipha flava]